jgi:hypothetical protein
MIVCLTGFLSGIFFILDGGYYVFMLFDKNVTLISCFVITLIECYIAVYFIGTDNLNKVCVDLTGFGVPHFFILSLKYISPAIFSFFTLSTLYNMLLNKSSYYSVLWPKLLEITIVSLPIGLILYFFIKYRNEEEKHEYAKEMEDVNVESLDKIID